jgi:hypothetical protein
MKYVMIITSVVCMLGCAQSNTTGNLSGTNLVSSVNVNFSQTNAMAVQQTEQVGSLENKLFNLMDSIIEEVAKASGTSQNLYAVQAGNGAYQIIHVTPGGADTCGQVANTKNFIVVQTSGVVNSTGEPCYSVAINKTTGATQCMMTHTMIDAGTTLTVQNDASGRYLFYLDYSANLWRYDTVTATPTLLMANIEEFAVNSDGDVLAAGVVVQLGMGNTSQTMNVISAPGVNDTVTGPWIGTVSLAASVTTINGVAGSQHFFFTTSPGSAACAGNYCELIKTGTTFALQQAPYTIPLCEANSGTCGIGWALATMYLNQPTANQPNFYTNNGQIDLVNGGTPANVITGTLPNTVLNIAGGGNYLATQAQASDGTLGLYRFNTGTAVFDTMMPAGQYQVTAYDVDNSGNVTVAGIRTSDNKNIVATIAVGSDTVNVVSSSLSSTASQIAVVK